MEKLLIQHTNDIHSHLENWPKIRRKLSHTKNRTDCEVFTVDLGDFCDRIHPWTEVTEGKNGIELMNEVGFDVVTIGNNEGIGNSKVALDSLYETADFEVVLGNLIDPATEEIPTWAKKEVILTTKEGTRVGFLGYTAPYPLTYEPTGWEILYPKAIMGPAIASLRKRVDVLVLLSHLGILSDRSMANHYPELDVIIGSHTHHLLRDGEVVNGVLIAAAGKYGEYTGEIEVLLEKGSILSKDAKTIKTENLPQLPDDQFEIQHYFDLGERLLEQIKVAQLPHEMNRNSSGETCITTNCLRAMCQKANVQAGMLNMGLFLKDLESPIVTALDLHQLLPHPMHLIKVELKGNDLLRLVLEMEKNRQFLRAFPIKGMGFRGKIFGEIIYAGIHFNKLTREVYFNGKLVDEGETYKIVTLDHYFFIPFFPTIELAGKTEFLFPDFLRTVFQEYLTATFPIQELEV
ncbi:MAG: metallophosphoesterase [Streptococcaceae bacterium]|nr:metallophosphoesterase [Streptococcaceae bacterium]